MWKAHNVTDAEFDKLFDYPRDRYARDRKGTQQVTILDFDLTEKELVSYAIMFLCLRHRTLSISLARPSMKVKTRLGKSFTLMVLALRPPARTPMPLSKS